MSTPKEIAKEADLSYVPGRWDVFQTAIDVLKRQEINVLETGAMVNFENGGSTWFFAHHPAVRRVDTCDMSERFFNSWHARFSLSARDKVHFNQVHSLHHISSMPNESVDLLYLDSDADRELTLLEFITAIPKLKVDALVLVDDLETKGRSLDALIQGHVKPFSYNQYGNWRLRLITYDRRVFAPIHTCGMLMFNVVLRELHYDVAGREDV